MQVEVYNYNLIHSLEFFYYCHFMRWWLCKMCRMSLSKRGRIWHLCFIHIAVVSKRFLRSVLGFVCNTFFFCFFSLDIKCMHGHCC